MAFVILLGLIILNGIFAMSELAIVSASKARLREASEADDVGASTAIELADDPNKFLSTVQIGITLVGIFTGAFGGSTIAGDLTVLLTDNFTISQSVAEQIALTIIVLITTYLSLVVGELVPKRIALSNPERISRLVSRPMKRLSQVSAPLVWFLSKSTEFIAGLLGVKGNNDAFVTDFEVLAMIREGVNSGEFDDREHEMVKGALELDDKRIRQITTPRTDIAWLDINASVEEIRQKLRETSFSSYPVYEGDYDTVVGVIRSKDLFTYLLTHETIDLHDILREPFYVPQTAVAADVLQKFKKSVLNAALVLDEFGGIAGIVTLNDIVEAVFGDVDMQDSQAIQRKDGSWLFDGLHTISDMPDILAGFILPEDEQSDYETLAGFVLKRMGRIPEAADSFDWGDYEIEIMDMDGQRIDKILISPLSTDN